MSNTHHTPTGLIAQKEAIMASVESDVRAFAAEFNTPNTLRLVALCEVGRIAWSDAANICKAAAANAIAEVA